MTSVQESDTVQEIHGSPRCSTPITDSFYMPDEENQLNVNWEKSNMYNEWKIFLEHEGLTRIFKLRGWGVAPEYWGAANSSMISGYFEEISLEQADEQMIARPAPPHNQMWLPLSYSSIWSDCHQDNQVWCQTPIVMGQPRHVSTSPPPVLGESGEAMVFNILNDTDEFDQHHDDHTDHDCDRRIQDTDCCAEKLEPMPCDGHHHHSAPMTTDHLHCQSNCSPESFTDSPEIDEEANGPNAAFQEDNVS